MNKLIIKTFFVISVAMLSVGFFIMRPAFATSGECSSHDGVDCAAGPSITGDAVCNDGWVSSVPYSETDECSATISCLTSDEVSQLTQALENEDNPIIQNLENEEQSAVAQYQQSVNNNSGFAPGACSSIYSQIDPSLCANEQQENQQEIQNIQAQYNLSIASEKNQLAQQEAKLELEQCTPQQEVWLDYVSTTDSCFEQNDFSPSCLTQGNSSQTSTPSVAAPSLPAPTDLNAAVISSSQINLQWEQSFTASHQIAGFKVYRNGLQIATTSYNSYSDMEGVPGTTYSYTIAEYDINGNVSPQSSATTATTLGTTSATSPSTPPPPTNSTISITGNLSIGNSGNNVVALQEFLETKGFLTLPSGTSNGYFGNLTKQALIAYQSSVGLPDTGYCGPMTRTAINSQ